MTKSSEVSKYYKVCEITEEHIKDGAPGEANACPIALALNDCENKADLIYEAEVNPSNPTYAMRHWVDDSETGRRSAFLHLNL